MITIDIEKKLKTYNGAQLLKVARHFTAGSITKIYGPSGVGKTTFLKIIAGFIVPEKGTITAEGNTWLDTSTKIFIAPQARKVGFVFQDYALFPNMTVQQHLEYATNDGEWIKKLLETGKMQCFTNHLPEHLSGGQQQRLAILRALAIKPTLLLMDEPFSAIDPETKSALISDLKIIFDDLNTTVLIVTHNLQEVDGLAGKEFNIN